MSLAENGQFSGDSTYN